MSRSTCTANPFGSRGWFIAADRVLVLVEGRCAYSGPQDAFWAEVGAVDEAGGHERAFVAFVERTRSAA